MTTDNTGSSSGNVPPKLDLRKSSANVPIPETPPPAPKKKTTRIEIPLPVAEPVGAEQKRATSRLTLDAMPTAAPPKTVRIVPADADAEKKKTSRIPLEAAFAPTEGETITPGSETATPKTIRIKRPTQVATVKLAVPGAMAESVAVAATPPPVVPPMAPPVPEKGQTARIQAPTEPTPEAQPTQRKTIKIRRAEGPTVSVPRSPVVARIEAEAEQQAAQEALDVGAAWNIVGIGSAVAALLVLGLLVYLLLAQAAPSLDLPFPGKITL